MITRCANCNKRIWFWQNYYTPPRQVSPGVIIEVKKYCSVKCGIEARQ